MSQKKRNKSKKRKAVPTSRLANQPEIHAFGDPTFMQAIYGDLNEEPSPGFWYQPFFRSQIHASVLRYSEAEYFLNQVTEGEKMHLVNALHFSESHSEIFQQIVTQSGLDEKVAPIRTFGLFALAHMLNENFSICSGLILSQIQAGHSKSEIQDVYPYVQRATLATDDQIAQFDGIVTSVGSQFAYERLNKTLPQNGGSSSGQVKI